MSEEKAAKTGKETETEWGRKARRDVNGGLIPPYIPNQTLQRPENMHRREDVGSTEGEGGGGEEKNTHEEMI